MTRIDNDIPRELSDMAGAGVQVLFQGHDGVFHLDRNHPEFPRLHALLADALWRKARVWFQASKVNLKLLDVQADRPP